MASASGEVVIKNVPFSGLVLRSNDERCEYVLVFLCAPSALSSSDKLARSFYQFVPVALLLFLLLIESVVDAEQRM